MKLLTGNDLAELMDKNDDLCITIYQLSGLR